MKLLKQITNEFPKLLDGISEEKGLFKSVKQGELIDIKNEKELKKSIGRWSNEGGKNPD